MITTTRRSNTTILLPIKILRRTRIRPSSITTRLPIKTRLSTRIRRSNTTTRRPTKILRRTRIRRSSITTRLPTKIRLSTSTLRRSTMIRRRRATGLLAGDSSTNRVGAFNRKGQRKEPVRRR